MCNAAKVRALNDAFRTSLVGGRVVATRGIMALPDVPAIIRMVRDYTDFKPEDDPYGEHDFGAFRQDDRQIFWKLDYFGADLDQGSPDPGDASVTTRVLTIMLAEEY